MRRFARVAMLLPFVAAFVFALHQSYRELQLALASANARRAVFLPWRGTAVLP